jgi:hypothetical protein
MSAITKRLMPASVLIVSVKSLDVAREKPAIPQELHLQRVSMGLLYAMTISK